MHLRSPLIASFLSLTYQAGVLMYLKLPLTSLITTFVSIFTVVILAENINAEEIIQEQPSSDILPFVKFACETRVLEEEGIPRKIIKNNSKSQLRVPVTVGYISDDQAILIYKWVRNYYPESAETPLEICDRVSATFDTLRQEEILGSISIGATSHGTLAVCAGSACSRPIFNLLPEENPEEVIEDLYFALTTEPEDETILPPSITQPGRGSSGGSNSGRSYVPPFSDFVPGTTGIGGSR
jgi:hypothetical protein